EPDSEGYPTLTVAVFLSDHHGTFVPGQRVSLDNGDINDEVGLSCGHFESDSHVDMVVAFNEREYWGFETLHGHGDGTFTDGGRSQPQKLATRGNAIELSFPELSSITVADLDGDGIDEVLQCSNGFGIFIQA